MRKRYSLIFLLVLLIVVGSETYAQNVPDFANIILEPAKADGAAYIQGDAEYQRVLDNIIRAPDFEKLRNLSPNSLDYQLSEKVGWIVIPNPSRANSYFFCTGFLVGPDLFLTNHHCIHDNFGHLPLDGVLVFMDYYQDDRARGGVSAGVSAVLAADNTKDYALLRLDTPIGNTYGWLELDTTTFTPDATQSVKLISHPAGRSKEIVRNNTEIVEIPARHPLSRRPFAIAYLADTVGGSSGSPVFLKDGSSTVIGIHHSGWLHGGLPLFNSGSLMAYIVPEIDQWLPRANTPDLTVGIPRLSTDFAMPGESVTITVSVVNQGSAVSTPTTLRFYASTDAEITTTDTEIGSATVDALAPTGTSEFSVTASASTAEGIYYYGACVDAVSGDPRIDNDCSDSVMLTVTDTIPTYMYWTNDDNYNPIQRAYLDGSNVQTVVGRFRGLEYPSGIAVDMVNHKVYWLDGFINKIQRANLDGSNIEDIFMSTSGPVQEESDLLGMALDIVNGKIYWGVDDKIQRANLDGSHIETLITDAGAESIALDVSNRKIYWGHRNQIQRSDFDGSNIEDIVTSDDSISIGTLAVDEINRKIYWTDWRSSKISRVNYDGSNIEDVLTSRDGLDTPFGMDLDIAEGKMYWTGWVTESIQRANLDGSNVETLVTDLRDPDSIALGIIQPVGTPQPPVDPPVDPPTEPPTEPPTDPPTDPPGPDPLDANGDGIISVLDLVFVAIFYGQQGDGLAADVNGDGRVNIQDLIAVAEAIDAAEGLPEYIVEILTEIVAGAPSLYNDIANALADTDHPVLRELLRLLKSEIPETTALLPNYPNPFNPETWIPYQLATPADVSITIYAANGAVVRHLPVGYRDAGIYQSKHRAVFWDGRTEKNEPAASGIYFYTLTTGKIALTRKMLIRK